MNVNKKNSKLQKLITEWPQGAVLSTKVLDKKDIPRQLVYWYQTHHWIEPVGNGAYKLVNDQIDCFGGIYSLQSHLNMDVHVGGKTSLELLGYAHYISEEMNTCQLYGKTNKDLPEWFRRYNWGLTIHYKTATLFQIELYTGFTKYPHKEFSIRISAPERAIMEMLYRVPSEHGFDESYRIMENLTTLRPEVVQGHLKLCKSVKVKRLFLFMAERADHAWVHRLHKSKLDLGSGNRQIVKDGVLNKEYKITVPREFSE